MMKADLVSRKKVIRVEETYNALNEVITKYSCQIVELIGEEKIVDRDVIALAELVSASANYKMAYRCHESGSLRGVR